jgi:dGTPase
MSKSIRMDWSKLLSTTRFSEFGTCKVKASPDTIRSEFERDWDQVIFSYPFRRLQDKTQVIPFPKFDFVHTRLTHTLEVASIGRSLGKMATKLIFSDESYAKAGLNFCEADLGTLVATACLAHDIGNPPFGHSGEDAISHYFTDGGGRRLVPTLMPGYVEKDEQFYYFQSYSEYGVPKKNADGSTDTYTMLIADYEKNLRDDYAAAKRWQDLATFEGNANGFRILTQNCEKGINPTCALLGAFSKYPRESCLIQDPYEGKSKKDKPKSQQKYGFFQAERDGFKSVAEELGLLQIAGIGTEDIAYCRHPLAFLMEAADDIAYRMIDFEDGCRLGLIDLVKPYKIISNKTPREILVKIAEKSASFKSGRVDEALDTKEAVAYLRAKVISVLLEEAFKVFQTNYENIMLGTFDKALLDEIPGELNDNLHCMEELVREQIYKYSPVLESEASGFEVMSGLIESFAITSNLCQSCGDKETKQQEKLMSLLPQEYKPQQEVTHGNLSFQEQYNRILRVLDYVSGMTDSYAIDLYRRIRGIKLPTE